MSSQQGWTINATTHSITFLVPPPAGTNNVVIKEYAVGAVGGTDCWAVGAWSKDLGYPTELEFFGDRMWWAATESDPQGIWASQTADYSNMGKSTPIVASDALNFAINTRQVNTVLDLVPLDKLLVFAKGGEFLTTGGQDDVIAPDTVNIKPQSYCGASMVQSKVSGSHAIFVQSQGQHVFALGYQFDADGYVPQDIMLFADHLAQNRTMVRLEWAPAPLSVIPVVRDDGMMIGCTFVPEQEVIGWHRQDTQGKFLDVCCLPGEKQTEVHVLTQRTVNGVSKVYHEQLADFFVDDIRDWCYLDSALTYDGRNTGAGTIKITTGGVDWSEGQTFTLESSDALFVGAGDVGDGFSINLSDGSTKRVIITGFIDANHVSVTSVGDVPPELQGIATTAWTLQRNTISGLDHLEGMTVKVLSDANVHHDVVVSGGSIVLDTPGGVVQVGLGYRALIETLEINVAGGDPARGSSKLVQSVGVLVKDTRGIKAGTDLDHLDEMPQREFENYGDPTLPMTGYGYVPVSAAWGQDNGHGFIVSDDPLPAEILAITPRVMIGDAG